MIATTTPKQRYYRERDPETDEEFLVYEDVPVLDEHTDDHGRVYNAERLAKVAANNNLRIDDTGDYVPIVEWHTSDDDDPRKDPPLVGLAGPFKLSKVGDVNPRYCIVARFRVYPDKHKTYQRRPRRSVEIWPETESDPSGMSAYLDPIAILGAETPRRDLGMQYSKSSADSKSVHYEMAAPGGMNTFIPSAGKKKQKYSEGEPMPETIAANPETINQFVEGVKPLIQQMIGDEMAKYMANDPANADPADEAALEEGLPPEAGLEDPMGGPPMGDVPPEGMGEGGEPPMPEGDLPMGTEDDFLDDDEQRMAKGMYCKMADKYSLGADEGSDFGGAMQYMNSMDEGDSALMGKYMKHHADDKEKQSYEKCCQSGANAMQNSKKGEPDKYRKERDEAVEKYSKLKEKYSKLETECIDLKDQITESKKQERYAKQHAALTERQREGFIFDMDEELAFVGKFGDEDADHHINVRIPEKYNKVPTGDVPLSEWSETENKFAKKSPAEKYSKAAYAATPVLRGQNQQVDYASTLKAMCAKDSEDVTLQDVLAVQNGI